MGRALGDLEKLLLLALLRRGGIAVGNELLDELEEHAGRTISPGALYNVMHRLETRALVEARVGDETPSRGGRRRKEYRILPAGKQELARSWSRMTSMASGLEDDLARLAEGR